MSKLVDKLSVTDIYDAANSLFAQSLFELAIERYNEAIDIATLGDVKEDISMSVRLHANRALCSIKLQRYEEAIKDCSVVLNIEPFHLKALYRRSLAYEYIGDITKAFNDAEVLMRLEKSNVSSSYRQISVLYNRLKAAFEADQKVMKSEGRPVSLVTNEQVLRLFFIEMPPRMVRITDKFTVRLCMGNEFSLWDRSHMAFPLDNQSSSQQPIVITWDLVRFDLDECCTTHANLSHIEGDVTIGVDGKVQQNNILF